MNLVDYRYVGHRAAHAIIAEIGPYRVSSDALQAINQFIDELVLQLLSTSLSLDLSRIKLALFSIIPSSLGKNAIVEAELEVKTFTETEPIDYEAYERMRLLGVDSPFPMDRIIPLVRYSCLDYCTLADKDEDENEKSNSQPKDDIISPILVIYLTTIIEHVAEYLLTTIGRMAENQATDNIRVKEVFWALSDDSQVGELFHRFALREHLEKRATAFGYNPSHPSLSSSSSQARPSSMMHRISMRQSTMTPPIDVSPAEPLVYDEEDPPVLSPRIPPRRPPSVLKDPPRPLLGVEGIPPRSRSTIISVYDPDIPVVDFEDLIRSGNTMRVSLTPNRLKSIEVHGSFNSKDYDNSHDDDEEEGEEDDHPWMRRSESYSESARSTASTASSVPPVPTLSTPNERRRKVPIEKARVSRPLPLQTSPIPPSPAIPAAYKQFENPRSAPKPPSRPSRLSQRSSTTELGSRSKPIESMPSPTRSKSRPVSTATGNHSSRFARLERRSEESPRHASQAAEQRRKTLEEAKRLERPSSMASKRQSMARPTSLGFMDLASKRLSTAGSVEPNVLVSHRPLTISSSSSNSINSSHSNPEQQQYHQSNIHSAEDTAGPLSSRDRVLFLLKSRQSTTGSASTSTSITKDLQAMALNSKSPTSPTIPSDILSHRS
ncbi:hypothetical protein J3Q64DRAFT_1841190 [Phycomyces blakesleeanus]|uniref:Uncharacterized protein n=1 Tax=Phycomyces blakesleeanus TaxID=4837 RepID=A0ABR3AJH0_PHYBL